MAQRFQAPRKLVELAVEQLKKERVVHPHASFNDRAEHGLRKEVAYRDRDFLHRLARTKEVEYIDEALQWLKRLDIVSSNAAYDKNAFENYRKEIKRIFHGSWTSFTPVMERLVYMLTSVKRPRRLLELGCFWGNTLAWFAGPCVGSEKQFDADVIYGVDWNKAMILQARKNFAQLPNSDKVTLIADDARNVIEQLQGPFDMVYLDANDPDKVPGLYLILLKQIYDQLPRGAWVLAHDIFDYEQADDLIDYVEWVRDKNHFTESLALDVDWCGIELSIK